MAAADHSTPASFVFIVVLTLVLNERTFSDGAKCPAKCFCSDVNVTCFQLKSELPQDIPSMTSSLSLPSNNLLEFPDLASLPRVTYLDLSHNELSSQPPSLLVDYSQLTSLNLSYNRLTRFPAYLFSNRTRLQNLSLIGNLIDSIEFSDLANFTALKNLHLSRNRLTHFPKKTFSNLTSLVYLDLSRNRLTSFEGLTFEGLKSLQVLSLRFNSINQMSDGAYYGLNNVVKLYLDYNNLTSISNGWLYGLSSLRHLSLTNNKIEAVEGNDWSLCHNLMFLNMSQNRLTSLTQDSFRALASLRRLYLDHNSISVIEEGALADLSALTVLELNHNLLPWDHGALTSSPFSGLHRLRRLNLAHNYIRHLSREALSGLTSLRYLDLSQNPIASLKEGSFGACPHLKMLRMNTTSLLCDCTLRWFHKWLGGLPRFSATVSASCLYPPWLRNVPFLAADPRNFTCEDFPKPILHRTPSSHVVLQGSTANLTCLATSRSLPSSFHWRKDGRILAGRETRNTDRVQEDGVALYSSTLLLHNVSADDQGAYQCIISNQLSSAYSPRALITVHVYPFFTKVPDTTVAVRVGGTARLVCAAKGLPPPEVSWRRLEGSTDHFPAARERRMHVMPSDDVFFIVNVKLSDSGVYSCTATNSAGTVAATVNLSVYEVPTMLNSLENKEVRVGESVTLDCRAAGGSPRPAVQWFKDGRPLRLVEDRYYLTAGGHILVMMHVLPSDAGLYLCRMANPLGMDEGTCYLSVLPQRDAGLVTGIVVISIVVCIVLTSLVWVLVIYRHRRVSRKTLDIPPPLEDSTFLCTDSSSEHSASRTDKPPGATLHRGLLGGSLGSLPASEGAHWVWAVPRSLSSHHLSTDSGSFSIT